MKWIGLLFAAMPLSATLPIGPTLTEETPVEITFVSERDLAIGSYGPDSVMWIDTAEYHQIEKLLVNTNQTMYPNNDLRYGLRSDSGYTHWVIGVYRPEGVPTKNARLMQIDVKVVDREKDLDNPKFAYTIAEKGLVEYECLCSAFATKSEREKYFPEIRAAVKELLKIAHESPGTKTASNNPSAGNR